MDPGAYPPPKPLVIPCPFDKSPPRPRGLAIGRDLGLKTWLLLMASMASRRKVRWWLKRSILSCAGKAEGSYGLRGRAGICRFNKLRRLAPTRISLDQVCEGGRGCNQLEIAYSNVLRILAVKYIDSFSTHPTTNAERIHRFVLRSMMRDGLDQ